MQEGKITSPIYPAGLKCNWLVQMEETCCPCNPFQHSKRDTFGIFEGNYLTDFVEKDRLSKKFPKLPISVKNSHQNFNIANNIIF